MTFLLWIALIALVFFLIVAFITLMAEPDVEQLIPFLTTLRLLGLIVLIAVLGQVTLTVTVGIAAVLR